MIQERSEMPSIIQYNNILHKYGIKSQEAYSFRNKYKEDKAFQRRSSVLEILM